MNKGSIYILAVAMILYGCAPKIVKFPETENLIKVYDDVKGTREELYTKANKWLVGVFNDAQSVIQHTDKEEGIILGKYLMYGSMYSGPYGSSSDSRIYATIDIRVKDNKARLEIKPQSQWRYDPAGMTVYKYGSVDAILEMKKLSESFHDALLRDSVAF